MKVIEINGERYVALKDIEKAEIKAKTNADYYKKAYLNAIRFFCPFEDEFYCSDRSDEIQVFYRNIRIKKAEGKILARTRADYEDIIKSQKNEIAGLKSQVARLKNRQASSLTQGTRTALKKLRDILDSMDIEEGVEDGE